MKEIINKSVVLFNIFTLSLVIDINILIVQYAFMFLLISALKGFNNTQESKSKTTAKWILVKVSNLSNAWCLKNYILIMCTLIFG